MTAPARRSRADASPRKKPARSTENGHVSAAPATPAKPLQTTKSGEVSASPAGADQLGDARMVAALVLLVREMQAALRDQGGEIMLLKAQMAALLKPAAAPRGFLALKVAAGITGHSPEWLRRKCEARKVDADKIGGSWFVKIGGKLEHSTSANHER
jgi:hypothetical protein